MKQQVVNYLDLYQCRVEVYDHIYTLYDNLSLILFGLYGYTLKSFPSVAVLSLSLCC